MFYKRVTIVYTEIISYINMITNAVIRFIKNYVYVGTFTMIITF